MLLSQGAVALFGTRDRVMEQLNGRPQASGGQVTDAAGRSEGSDKPAGTPQIQFARRNRKGDKKDG
jgi:hypothetical protein